MTVSMIFRKNAIPMISWSISSAVGNNVRPCFSEQAPILVLSTLKNVKNEKEPVIIELKKAIAKRVEADMPGKIADAKLKENRDLTLTEIKKMKSSHASIIRFRCVGKLLECTYSVVSNPIFTLTHLWLQYYHHAKAILDHIELLIKEYEAPASPDKRSRIQEAGLEEVNAEIDRVNWFKRDRETMTVIDRKLTEIVSA